MIANVVFSIRSMSHDFTDNNTLAIIIVHKHTIAPRAVLDNNEHGLRQNENIVFRLVFLDRTLNFLEKDRNSHFNTSKVSLPSELFKFV